MRMAVRGDDMRGCRQMNRFHAFGYDAIAFAHAAQRLDEIAITETECEFRLLKSLATDVHEYTTCPTSSTMAASGIARAFCARAFELQRELLTNAQTV
jgi:hypothetical protein